jgi:hypothetical protein
VYSLVKEYSSIQVLPLATQSDINITTEKTGMGRLYSL